MRRCCWCVWVHGCIGMHYWLSLAPWYPRVRPVLFALAVALPVSGAGRLLGGGPAGGGADRRSPAPGRSCRRPRARPTRRPSARLVTLHDRLRPTFLALLGLALLVPVVRIVRRAAGAKVEVTYRGGPVVRVPPGPTLLEISRMKRRAACLRVRRPRALLDLPGRRGERARPTLPPPAAPRP